MLSRDQEGMENSDLSGGAWSREEGQICLKNCTVGTFQRGAAKPGARLNADPEIFLQNQWVWVALGRAIALRQPEITKELGFSQTSLSPCDLK